MDIFKFLRKPASKDVAKSRLRFVLVQDRFSCSPETLEQMKTDILRVISNYVVIDEEGLDIQFANLDEAGESPMVAVNIPILGTRKRKS